MLTADLGLKENNVSEGTESTSGGFYGENI